MDAAHLVDDLESAAGLLKAGAWLTESGEDTNGKAATYCVGQAKALVEDVLQRWDSEAT